MGEEYNFLCPECGNKEYDEFSYTTSGFEIPMAEYPIYNLLRCARCKHEISGHIAQREGMTIEEARRLWQAHYRSKDLDGIRAHGGFKALQKRLVAIGKQIPETMAAYVLLMNQLMQEGSEQERKAGEFMQRIIGLLRTYYAEKTRLDKKWM